MRHLWLDAGYNGRGRRKDWVEQVTGWTSQTVEALRRWEYYWAPRDIPRRWVVERTFAWLSHNRWLSKVSECLCSTNGSWIYVAMIRLMVKRLARS